MQNAKRRLPWYRCHHWRVPCRRFYCELLGAKPHTVPEQTGHWSQSGGLLPGLDGTGSWQCRPKAGTGTDLGLDFLLRTTSEDKLRLRTLLIHAFLHVFSIGIDYQPLIEVFRAKISLFYPVMTSFLALDPWVWLGLAGTGTGSADRRPGLDGTGSRQCRPRAGTETGIAGQRPGLQSPVWHCVWLGT